MTHARPSRLLSVATWGLCWPTPAKPIGELVARARCGDRLAWDLIVERYTPLVWSICHRYQLERADAEDVSQSASLRLVAKLDSIRDPAALPSWLSAITERQCVTMLSARRSALNPPDLDSIPDERAGTVEQELLAAERRAAVREAVAALSPDDRELIGMLAEDPPRPYAEIAARMGVPVGSIGPTRRRCRAQMRRHPAIAQLIAA